MLGALNDIKVGLIINYEGVPYIVMNANFMRKSQGKPVMQTKMKSLLTDKTLEISFKTGDKIEEADVKRRSAQFLYTDTNAINFMNDETFDQFTVPLAGSEDKIKFLKEGGLYRGPKRSKIHNEGLTTLRGRAAVIPLAEAARRRFGRGYDLHRWISIACRMEAGQLVCKMGLGVRCS